MSYSTMIPVSKYNFDTLNILHFQIKSPQYLIGSDIKIVASFNTKKEQHIMMYAEPKYFKCGSVIDAHYNMTTDFTLPASYKKKISKTESEIIDQLKNGIDTVDIFSVWIYAQNQLIINVEKDTFVDQIISCAWWQARKLYINPNDKIIVMSDCDIESDNKIPNELKNIYRKYYSNVFDRRNKKIPQ